MLLQLVAQFGTSWASIAKYIPGRTDQQCMGRWKRHLDPNINRDSWTHLEDVQLCALVSRYDNQWSSVARALDGRTGQLCRTRWAKLNQSHFEATFKEEIEAVDIEALERAQERANRERERITGLPTASTRVRIPGQRKDGKKTQAKPETIRLLGKGGGAKSGARGYGSYAETAPGISLPSYRPEAFQAVNGPGVYTAQQQMYPTLPPSLNVATLQYPPGLQQQMYPAFPQQQMEVHPVYSGAAGYPQQGHAPFHHHATMYGQAQQLPQQQQQQQQQEHWRQPDTKKRRGPGRPTKAELEARRSADEHKDSSLLLDAVSGFGGTSLVFDHGQVLSLPHGYHPGKNYYLEPLSARQPTKRGRGRPRKQHAASSEVRWEPMPLDTESPSNAFGGFRQAPCRGARSDTRKRLDFEEVATSLDIVDRVWRSGGDAGCCGFGSYDMTGARRDSRGKLAAQATVPVPEDGTMLSINGLNQHMTPFKPKNEAERSNSTSGTGKSLGGFHAEDGNAASGGFFGLEYLTDDKLPGVGSKTPLSALKRVPKTAASPMLADLLRSPQMNTQGLVSPAPIGKRGGTWNPVATPDANRLVRCLDLSDAATAAVAGSTPGSAANVVLDSASRLNPGTVMMKNTATVGEAGRVFNAIRDAQGQTRQQFVQMPVFNAIDGVLPVGVQGGLGAEAQAKPADRFDRFEQLAANGDKAVNRRRLSSESVRISLHALLEQA